MFRRASDSAFTEIEGRRGARANLRSFGVKFLDDALIGISPSDLVLVGAPSGIGKTQLCCNIALSNMADGKQVYFLALEAEDFEIERRMKYQILASMYFSDGDRPRIGTHLSYERWVLGDFVDTLSKYEKQASEFFESAYKNLHILYRGDSFTIHDLMRSTLAVADLADIFVIDHAHYFDFDDDNENRALKEIAKTVRSIVLSMSKPVILVAHLRKRDRGNEDLVPGMDEFHGSSDLVKIATKVVTMSPGMRTADGCYETFFRIPKNRLNGGSSRFIGRVMFDPRKNAYETQYKVGSATLTRRTGFEELAIDFQPEWAKGTR